MEVKREKNVQNKKGYPDMYFPQMSILQVGMIYTINMYKVYEAEHVKGQGCYQDHVNSVQNERITKHVYFVFEK